MLVGVLSTFAYNHIVVCSHEASTYLFQASEMSKVVSVLPLCMPRFKIG